MKKYYNTIEELKYAYEHSDMSEEQLQDIINKNQLSNPTNIYYKLKGNRSLDKANILVGIWKKIHNYEIY